jgi:hypothetical protein
MNKTVTVDDALKKGHRIVSYPGMLILFGMLGLTFYFGFQNKYPVWIWPLGLTLSFALSWLYWSVMITKWKLWAFENVRNVRELKKRAVQEKLIWGDNSIFEKTEIRNSGEKQKLSLLQQKFNAEDEFTEDLTVPNETIIYYSKGKNLFEMAIMLGCLGIGLYLLIKTDSYILGTALTLIGGYFAFKEYKEATNITPQIIINNEGIQTVSTKFYEWKDIKNEEAIIHGSNNCYLTYKHPQGTEHLQIDGYATDFKNLNKLLILYRGRNRKMKSYR